MLFNLKIHYAAFELDTRNITFLSLSVFKVMRAKRLSESCFRYFLLELKVVASSGYVMDKDCWLIYSILTLGEAFLSGYNGVFLFSQAVQGPLQMAAAGRSQDF